MSNRFHVSTRKGLFTFARKRSGRWDIEQANFLGDNCTLLLHDPRKGLKRKTGEQGALYAALDHGHFGVKLHRSKDSGKSWKEIGVPIYPTKPKDYQRKSPPTEGQDYAWSLSLIWSLAHGGPKQKGRLWCGTLPGGLFTSDDYGDTWQLNEALWNDPMREKWFGGGMDVPGIHSICVDPRDPDHVILAISCGGAWITRDGGKTWQVGGEGMRAEFMPPKLAYDPLYQDPHMMVHCNSQPDRLWVQHHNGIFRSDDAAASWVEIEQVKPSNFGFAVAVHPHQPDTAWFVPAIKDEKRIPVDGKLVVTRTRNGGKSFKTLRKGLPQKNAYDLVLRHALDVDGSGERLVFGSTTGSIWLSEDGGDSWQTLSTHLPPVYAVQFER